MARSRKRSPYYSTPHGAKWFKRVANKALRASFRTIEKTYDRLDQDEIIFPVLDDVSDLYSGPKDGCGGWHGWIKYPDWDEYNQRYCPYYGPAVFAKLMRK